MSIRIYPEKEVKKPEPVKVKEVKPEPVKEVKEKKIEVDEPGKQTEDETK